MGLFYFDAEPLLHRADACVASPDPRCGHIGAKVDTILTDKSATRAMSEVTVGEYWSQVCIRWRDGNRRQHDRAWAEAAQGTIMKWIQSGVITVLPIHSRAMDWALTQVRAATSEQSRNLRAWDAVHLAYATKWARESGQKVEIVTGDRAFAGFLEVFPGFQQFVEITALT